MPTLQVDEYVMQFTTKTIFVLFVVVASSFAAFELYAILIAPVCIFAVYLCVWRNCGCALAFVGSIVLIVALLLPAISCVRESALRVWCINNMRQLGMAFHNYHDAYGCFPPAYVINNQGKRLHSWRILITPFMEETTVHKVYNFKEPWNGPNNSSLAVDIPPSYRCASARHKNGRQANYFAVTGPGTAWPEGRGSRLDEFTDGTSNTIMVVELWDHDIQWLEPRDVTLDEALGPPGGQTSVPQSKHYIKDTYWFRSMPVAGNVLMADGSVHTIVERLSRDELAALLSIAGGEKVDIEEIIKRNTSISTSLKYFHWDRAVGLPLFFVSLIWFWRRLLADSKLNPKSEPRP